MHTVKMLTRQHLYDIIDLNKKNRTVQRDNSI